MDTIITLDSLRKDIIGRDVLFETPFGLRNLFYADYTASGRGVYSIENTLLDILKSYANTHTEDDYTGKYLTGLLHQAEQHIKDLVHAGPDGKLFSIGSGSTGALKKLQEIIGVSIPPVTRERINQICTAVTGKELNPAGAPEN
ncbi:MAG: hypothetical protein MUP70_03995, partial [Candidatus Aminicenantes bacterium]|nr:hypothetical protein [Candidatus Aminicenantes bacterium]